MAYTLTDIVNNSATAQQRREEVLRGLKLPYDGEYVRGCVPREYLRLMAEEEAAPEGAAQVAICLYDEARRAGLEVTIDVDEYNSPTNYDLRVGRRLTLMVQSCGAGCSIIIDGETGFPVVDMAYSEWAQIFKEVAASKE